MRRKPRAWSLARSGLVVQGAMRPSSRPHCDRGQSAATFFADLGRGDPAGWRHDDHDPFREPVFRRHAGNLRARSTETRMPDALWRFPAATGAIAPGADALLAFGPDLHRREFHRQGGRAARCRRAWHRACRAGYKSPRAQHSGRGGELRFWPWRWFLRRRHRGAMVTGIPDVFVCREGVARGRRCDPFRSTRRAPESSVIRWAGMAR